MQLDPTLTVYDPNIKVRVALHQRLAIVQVVACAQYGQRTVTEALIQARLPVIEQPGNFCF